MDVHTDAQEVTEKYITFIAPPVVLNETDTVVSAEVHLTLDTQLWHKVPINLDYTDSTRVLCNEAVSITNYQGLHFNEPRNTLVPVLGGAQWPYPGSREGMVAVEDGRQQSCQAERLWVVREAHNAPPCVSGTPMMCGSVIRLRNMVTHTNLRSTAGVHSVGVRQQEVSHEGMTGHGNY